MHLLNPALRTTVLSGEGRAYLHVLLESQFYSKIINGNIYAWLRPIFGSIGFDAARDPGAWSLSCIVYQVLKVPLACPMLGREPLAYR